MARASYDMWNFEIYPLGIEKGENFEHESNMAKYVSRKIILAAESRVEAKGKPNELMRIYVMTVLICMGQKR